MMQKYSAVIFLMLSTLPISGSELWADEGAGFSNFFALNLRRHSAGEGRGSSNLFSLDLRTSTAVLESSERPLPDRSWLAPPYPNPFNSTTTLEYLIRNSHNGEEHVVIAIYSINGQLVRVLTDESVPAGRYQIYWEGTDWMGYRAGSGVYFAVMLAGEIRIVRKMVLLQ